MEQAHYAGTRAQRIAELERELALLRAAEAQAQGEPPDLLTQAFQTIPGLTCAHLLAVGLQQADMYFVFDAAGYYRSVVLAKPELLAAPETELLGRHLNDMVPPAVAQPVLAAIAETLATGAPVQVEYALHVPSGEAFFIGRLQRLEADRVLMAAYDATTQRNREVALRLPMELQQQAGVSADMGFWVLDLATMLTHISAPTLPLWGLHAGSAILPHEESLQRMIHPDDLPAAHAALEQVFGGATPVVEERIQMADGSYHWFRVSGKLTELPDGSRYVTGTLQDIQRWKETEAALLEREAKALALQARWDAIVQAARDIITLLTPDGRVVFDTPSSTHVLGYADGYFDERSIWEFIHPDDLDKTRGAIAQAVANPHEPQRLSFRFRHADGRWLHLESIGYSLLDVPAVGALLVVTRDQSERVAVEEQLREQQARLADAQRIAHLGYMSLDLTTRKTFWTPETFSILRQDPKRPPLSPREALLRIAPEEREAVRTEVEQLMAGQRDEGAVEFHWADAASPTPRCIAMRLNLERDAAGTPTRLAASLQDITVQRQTEADLRSSRQLFQTLYHESADALFIVDAVSLSIRDCNPTAVEMFQAESREQLIGGFGPSFHVTSSEPDWIVRVRAIVERDSVYSEEILYRGLRGREFWGLLAVKEFVLPGERLQLVRVTDITEQRQALEAVREGRLLLQAVFENAADANLLLDARSYQVADCNLRALELFGIDSKAELQRLGLAVLFSAPENRRSLARLRACLRSQTDVRVELPFRSVRGRALWGEVAVTAVRFPGRGFLLVRIADITSMKEAQDALLAAETRYRSIFEHSIEGIFQTTITGQVLLINPPMAALLGYETTAELLADANNLSSGFYVDLADRNRLVQIVLRDGFIRSYEYRLRRRDGSVIWVSENARLVRNAQGEVLYLEGSMIDITERKSAEEQLRAAERLYRDIFQNAAEGLFQTTLDGTFLTVNPPFAQLLGYASPEQLAAETDNRFPALFPHPAVREHLLARLQAGERYVKVEHTLRRRDGRTVWVLQSARLVREGGQERLEGSVIDITERRHAEEALRERESRLQALMAGLPVIVYKLDTEGRVTLTEGRGLQAQGWTPESVLGASVFDIYPDEAYQVYIRRALAGEEGLQWHTERNGLFYETRTTVLRDATGRVSGLIGVETDVTQRVWAEQLLRASESRFRSLAENAPDFIIICDAETWEVIYINRMEFLGWRSDTLTKGTRLLMHIPSEDLELLTANRRMLLKRTGESTVTSIIRCRNAHGQYEWLQVRETLLSFRENGRARELLATVSLITERMRTEEALRRSESLYSTIIRHFPNGIILLYDRELRTLIAGGQLIEQSGLEAQQLIGRSVLEILPTALPANLPAMPEDGSPDTALDPESIRMFEMPINQRLHRVYTVPVKNMDGDVIAGLLMSQDITEQRRFEQAVLESEERFRALLQHSSDIIITLSAHRDIRFVTPAVTRILQYQPHELLDQPIDHYLHPEDLELFAEAFDLALQDPGRPVNVEFRIRRQDGSWAYFEAQGSNLLGLESVRAVVANLRNITDRKQAESQLRASVREKEVLLQEIYHRVKNNLQVVSSLLEIQSDSVTDESTLALLRESQARIYSIALVHEKLYQSRDLHNIDFKDYVGNLAAYIRQAFGGEGQVDIELDIVSLPINLDIAMRCGLVLNELISNAIKYAFPAGRMGTITVQAKADKGNLSLLSVRDNGVGMPQDSGKRSGSLGLRLVDMIARQLRARVQVHSDTQGTAFELHFEEPLY